MKVGGNAAAADFFNKHGGSALLTESDAKKKYSSKTAELYRAELDKREAADAKMNPTGVVLEGAIDASSASTSAKAEDDDFFDSWDKPTPKATSSAAPGNATKPSIGRATSAPVPRTVTSASLRAGSSGGPTAVKSSRLGLGASRLGSSTSSTGATTTGSKKLGGLKATKAAAPIDFEKAQREAEEEEERIRQLGYDRKREEEEAAAAAVRAAEDGAAALKAASTEIGGPAKTGLAASSSTSSGNAKLSTHNRGNSQDMARLGMGMKRLGLGTSAPNSPGPSSTASPSLDESNYARTNFGAQKAISSDMYFGRGVHDPTRSAEAQARLAQFNGATSISSAAYFGREEEEGGEAGGAGIDGVLGDGSLESVQAAAREAIYRVMSNPDVQNGVESLRAGALKVNL